VYPEIDEDGAEARAARVEWIGVKLDGAVRRSPLTADLKSLIDYRTSRTIPTKEEAESDEAKRSTRAQATNDKKVTPEEFEASFAATPKAWYRQLVSDLDTTDAAIQSLDDLCRQRFGDVSPSFRPLRDAVLDVRQVAGQLLARKPPEAGDPAGAVAGAPSAVGAAGMASESTSRAAGTFSSEGPRTREEAAAWIAAAATRIRRDHPTEPAAYLMVRGFRWGELRAAGGAIDPRLLIAPSTETRIRLRGLRLDARWAELLDAAEELMANSRRSWLGRPAAIRPQLVRGVRR
jgi:type VI secretion system protein ImpA